LFERLRNIEQIGRAPVAHGNGVRAEADSVFSAVVPLFNAVLNMGRTRDEQT
jgi:hypothetical protein